MIGFPGSLEKVLLARFKRTSAIKTVSSIMCLTVSRHRSKKNVEFKCRLGAKRRHS